MTVNDRMDQKMNTNLTDRFIDNLCAIEGEEISDAVYRQAKRCLLDYLGASFAGARMAQEKGKALLKDFGKNQNDAAVIGFGRKSDILSAAFVNGLSSHIAELDDGVISGIVHPGSPLFSALLPLAEKENVSGADFLMGVITGYEAIVRTANAMQPSHKVRGYHATGTCGMVGAALGIGAMLRLSTSIMKDALSSAVVSAAGTLKVLEDDSELKPLNVGHAALGGVLAVSMARAGFQGPKDAFSGKMGFFSVMADEFDATQLEPAKDEAYAVEKVYVKPYAACRYCHPAIDAVLKIRSDHRIRPEDIESVNVATYRLAVANHDHTQINGISSAKMSIPYSVAVALSSGRAGLREYSMEFIQDSAISSLTKKISVRADDHLSDLFPDQCGAVVEVTTRDGNSLSASVDTPRGEPETPLSDDEINEKFASLAGYANRSEEDIQKVIEIVWNLERDLPNLFELL